MDSAPSTSPAEFKKAYGMALSASTTRVGGNSVRVDGPVHITISLNASMLWKRLYPHVLQANGVVVYCGSASSCARRARRIERARETFQERAAYFKKLTGKEYMREGGEMRRVDYTV